MRAIVDARPGAASMICELDADLVELPGDPFGRRPLGMGRVGRVDADEIDEQLGDLVLRGHGGLGQRAHVTVPTSPHRVAARVGKYGRGQGASRPPFRPPTRWTATAVKVPTRAVTATGRPPECPERAAHVSSALAVKGRASARLVQNARRRNPSYRPG